MINKRNVLLFCILVLMASAVIGGLFAASRIESPADAAARTAAPTPSPILVPVEKRVLSSDIVARGTARFGLPQSISIVPSALKGKAGLITTIPLRNTQFGEGEVMLTASGRPVFVLQGETPAFRDLVPGLSGGDVRQLEKGLARLGFDPGPVDGTYDSETSAAVAKWYTSAGWEPFGPTLDQRAGIQALEREWNNAAKNKVATAGAAAAAALAVKLAHAKARHAEASAAAELAAKKADRRTLMATPQDGTPLAIVSARAQAEQANRAATAEIETKIAARSLVMLDPRSTRTARAAADAQLELARAIARRTQLEGRMAIQAAEREVQLAPHQFELAEAAVWSARLEGEMAVQVALDARRIAELEAKLAADRADRLGANLAKAKSKLGVQIPVDEIVFIPALPVRAEKVTAAVGDSASGPVMSVTDNRLSIDSALPLNAAPLVKRGMRVAIDEQALGIKATGVVERVAKTPGTRGVDGFHLYFEVRVDETPTQLKGFSLRLTIPIKSTKGAVTVVPLNALTLAADGTSRVQVKNQDTGVLEYVVVEPGLSADGFVEVIPVDGGLEPDQLVVVGYDTVEVTDPQVQ